MLGAGRIGVSVLSRWEVSILQDEKGDILNTTDYILKNGSGGNLKKSFKRQKERETDTKRELLATGSLHRFPQPPGAQAGSLEPTPGVSLLGGRSPSPGAVTKASQHPQQQEAASEPRPRWWDARPQPASFPEDGKFHVSCLLQC